MDRILVLPSYEYFATYSGTRNLLKRLAELNVDFYVLMRIDPKNRSEYCDLGYQCVIYDWWSPKWSWFRRRVSIVLYRILVLFHLLRANSVLVIDSMYLWEVSFVSKFRKKMKVVQFCQELQIIDDYPDHNGAISYSRYAKLPDLVVDVDPLRAAKRKERFGLKDLPLVLRNTLPVTEITLSGNESGLAELSGVSTFRGLPVLLYAGGIGVEKPFSRLVDAVALMEHPVFFLAFCSTGKERFEEACEYASSKLSPGTYKICGRVRRSELLKVVSEADIGIVDYPYSYEKSWNQLYCAPTKLYEYLGAGLAVVGSNNDSLRIVVEDKRAGLCAKSDSIEDLAKAIDGVVASSSELQLLKRNARRIFMDEFCYEKCCYPVIDKIVAYLKIPSV